MFKEAEELFSLNILFYDMFICFFLPFVEHIIFSLLCISKAEALCKV